MIINGETITFSTKVKLIFWDFDGVFNKLDGKNTTKQRAWTGTIGFDPELISNLNYLCSQLDKEWDFIISSSWRTQGMGHCIRALLDAGFEHTQLQRWMNRTGRSITRGHEIMEYVSHYSVPVDFIVIDDEQFDIIGDYKELTDDVRNHIRPNFYQTDMKQGLTMKDVHAILEMAKSRN